MKALRVTVSEMGRGKPDDSFVFFANTDQEEMLRSVLATICKRLKASELLNLRGRVNFCVNFGESQKLDSYPKGA